MRTNLSTCFPGSSLIYFYVYDLIDKLMIITTTEELNFQWSEHFGPNRKF